MADQISLTFPDGSSRAYPAGTTPSEVAAAISPSLAKRAISARVDGAHWDLQWPLTADSAIEIKTLSDDEGLELIRHDAAHIMARAVQELWPDVKAMEERVNGVAPPRVEPRTVDTPFGRLKGGYYPMVYDPNSIKGADIKRMQAEGLFDQAYVRATTRAGATRKRSEGFNAPVWLSLGVIGQHINEVSHDIAFREAVIDSYRKM